MNNLENVNKLFAAAIAFAIITTGCSAEADSSEINSLPEKATTYAEISTENTSETISPTEEISSTETETAAATENSEKISPLVNFPEDVPFSAELNNLFTERDLRTEYEITESVDLNQVKDSVLEITQEGVYELSGQFSGQIHICCDGGKIQLVLNNAEISCSTGPAIYVEQAKKVFLTLAEHSENVLSDGTGYANETISGAAIFSADDLTINGTGNLQVTGNEDEGIVSKDKLTITGGKITVNAKGNGIRGKDDIAVYDGEMEVISGGDGLKSNNATDAGKGFIYIQNGKFTINAQEDGIQAETELIISSGELNITSGGGTANAPEKQNSQNSMIPERFTPQNTSNADSENSENQISTKGMKAGTMAYFSGGIINMNTSDDALHSNGKIYLSGAELEISSGDKAIHADTEVLISSGIVNIAQAYEGIESGNITISGGTVNITSSDDGFNASDGSEQGAMGAVSDCALTISGGEVSVNSGGDGLDSNGMLNITGGKIFVNGSENGGNGALDANNGINCSGGFLFASGMADMADIRKIRNRMFSSSHLMITR